MPNPSEIRPRRPRRWTAKPLLVLVSCLLGLLLFEFGLRAVHAATGEAYDSARVWRHLCSTVELGTVGTEPAAPGEVLAAEFPPEADKNAGAIASPFFGFDAGYAALAYDVQRRWFEDPRAEETLDIFVVGGSVAAQVGSYLNGFLEQVTPPDSRLAARTVRVFNNGRGGFKQPQQLNLVAYLIALGCRPDVVINVDGFNEVALGAFNAFQGANPLQPSLGHWGGAMTPVQVPDPRERELVVDVVMARRRAEELLETVRRWGLTRSAITGSLALRAIGRTRERIFQAQEAYQRYLSSGARNPAVFGPALEDDGEAGTNASAACWYESSRMLRAVCEARGIDSVHLLQPTLHDAGSKPLTDEEVRTGSAHSTWIEGARRGYPKLRALGQQLEAEGETFLDASMCFADCQESRYVDACHFNEAGVEQLAAACVQALEQLLPAPR